MGRKYVYQMSEEEFKQHNVHLVITARKWGLDLNDFNLDFIRHSALEKLFYYDPEKGTSFRTWSIQSCQQAILKYYKSSMFLRKQETDGKGVQYDDGGYRVELPVTYQKPKLDDTVQELLLAHIESLAQPDPIKKRRPRDEKALNRLRVFIRNEGDISKTAKELGISRFAMFEVIKGYRQIARADETLRERCLECFS